MTPLPRLLLITDRTRMRLPIVEAVSRALAELPRGVGGVLLREKDLPGITLVELAHTLREVTHAHGASLFVAGRLDVALACAADGVSLGHEAPAFDDVRALAQSSLHVGLALHGDELPPPGAAFALLSPIFETTSKPGLSALGLEALRARARATAVPLYALGGIDQTNVRSCFAAGAAGVAVVGAVLGADDPARAAAELAASADLS